jgi:type II secretory pathway pseudopilin PulG
MLTNDSIIPLTIHAPNQKGFSYVDVMIGIVILMVGITGLVAAITAAVVTTRNEEEHLKAKQLATSSLESILSARDLDQLQWKSIANNNVPQHISDGEVDLEGIFLTGSQPIKNSPGTDGVIGTFDDTDEIVDGFMREIKIAGPNGVQTSAFDDQLRRVEVIIYYQSSVGVTLNESISTYVGNPTTEN